MGYLDKNIFNQHETGGDTLVSEQRSNPCPTRANTKQIRRRPPLAQNDRPSRNTTPLQQSPCAMQNPDAQRTPYTPTLLAQTPPRPSQWATCWRTLAAPRPLPLGRSAHRALQAQQPHSREDCLGAATSKSSLRLHTQRRTRAISKWLMNDSCDARTRRSSGTATWGHGWQMGEHVSDWGGRTVDVNPKAAYFRTVRALAARTSARPRAAGSPCPSPCSRRAPGRHRWDQRAPSPRLSRHASDRRRATRGI